MITMINDLAMIQLIRAEKTKENSEEVKLNLTTSE